MMLPVAVQFGLSPGIKDRLWLEARNAAVQDAKGTAQLYAKARPGAQPYSYFLTRLSVLPLLPTRRA